VPARVSRAKLPTEGAKRTPANGIGPGKPTLSDSWSQ